MSKELYYYPAIINKKKGKYVATLLDFPNLSIRQNTSLASCISDCQDSLYKMVKQEGEVKPPRKRLQKDHYFQIGIRF